MNLIIKGVEVATYFTTFYLLTSRTAIPVTAGVKDYNKSIVASNSFVAKKRDYHIIEIVLDISNTFQIINAMHLKRHNQWSMDNHVGLLLINW